MSSTAPPPSGSPASPSGGPPRPPDPPTDPAALLRDRSYVLALLSGAVIGIPIAVFSYFFLAAVSKGQEFFFTNLPKDLGFQGEPAWWPVLPLVTCGLVVALSIRYLPGTGGHSPVDGLKATGTPAPNELPGIFLAALATLCLGAVLGPEAPLIALGGGFGALAVHLLKRDAPAMASVVIGVAGSFAALSTLLGSPIVGAFLLMEVAGLGGGLLSVILVPGLLAAGIGSLIFIGLDSWTGLGSFSLAIPHIPSFTTPDSAELLWAIGIGMAGAVVGTGIRRLGVLLRSIVEPRTITLMPALGLGIAGLAIAFAQVTGKSSNEVLFSGQSALSPLVQHSASWSVGALVFLVLCKGLAYGASLSSFRGGPVFPGMFIGAAGGIALSHLPGLPMIAGVAMGIGAMSVAMLGLPLTSVLLTTLFLQADAASLTPLVIVTVVVAYVVSARLVPAPAPQGSAQEAPQERPAPAVTGAPPRAA